MVLAQSQKLDWKKIVIFFVLFIIFTFFSLLISTVGYFCADICPSLQIDWVFFSIFFVISFIISYLISSFIVKAFTKVKK